MKSILKYAVMLVFAQIGCAASLEPEGEPPIVQAEPEPHVEPRSIEDVIHELGTLHPEDMERMKAVQQGATVRSSYAYLEVSNRDNFLYVDKKSISLSWPDGKFTTDTCPVRAIYTNNITENDFAFLTNPENNLYLPSLRTLPSTSHVLFGLLDPTRVTKEMRLKILLHIYLHDDLAPTYASFINSLNHLPNPLDDQAQNKLRSLLSDVSDLLPLIRPHVSTSSHDLIGLLMHIFRSGDPRQPYLRQDIFCWINGYGIGVLNSQSLYKRFAHKFPRISKFIDRFMLFLLRE
jgi:hypothetical protein